MAIVNDPRLYLGGSERINTRPSVQLYGQLMARKQARDDAYDEYIRNLNKSINSAGMRNVDRQAFDKQLSDWQKFGMERKDDIRNRRNGADIEYMQKYQGLLNTVSESKTEEEKKKPAVEMLLDPNKRDRLNNDDFLKAIHEHDQPIYITDEKGELQRNPNRKSLDYQSVVFNPKPFEQDKYFKQFEDIKKMDLPPQVVKNPKDMTQTVTTTSIFDPEAKEIVRTRATTDYFQNPAFKSVIDQLNPDEYNEDFKKQYGHDIENKGDLAAAYTLKGLQTKAVKSELKEDNFGQRKALAALNHSYRLGEKEFEHALDRADKVTANLWFDDAIDEWTNTARKNPDGTIKPSSVIETQSGWKEGHKIPVTSYLAKAMMKDDKSPDDIFVTTENEYIPVFYKRNDKGIKIPNPDTGLPEVNKTLTVPESREMFKLDIGGQAGMKQKNIEMSGNKVLKETTIKSSTKSSSGSVPAYMKSDLIGAGWTEDQIKEAVKAGKIKTN
jgi:hypothetical protein